MSYALGVKTAFFLLCTESEAMDQSHSLAHTQIGERGEYTQIPSAEPVNLSKSEELSLPSQNKGEIQDTRNIPFLGFFIAVFTTLVHII